MGVVVITGGNSGIGDALALELGRRGHRLVLAARREEELVRVGEASGAAYRAIATDVTSRQDVERLRDEAIAAFGQVDVWVNNAGRGITRRVLDLTDAEFDEMMAVNVKSALYGMQAIVPHFQARGRGHLINVSSFLARVPLASYRSAYSAAKAALNALTANLRMDLAEAHPEIQVSIVMPGIVATPFAENALGGTPQPTPSAVGPQNARMTAQTAHEVGAILADLIDRPIAEVFTNPASPEMARRYCEDPVAFEAGLRARR